MRRHKEGSAAPIAAFFAVLFLAASSNAVVIQEQSLEFDGPGLPSTNENVTFEGDAALEGVVASVEGGRLILDTTTNNVEAFYLIQPDTLPDDVRLTVETQMRVALAEGQETTNNLGEVGIRVGVDAGQYIVDFVTNGVFLGGAETGEFVETDVSQFRTYSVVVNGTNDSARFLIDDTFRGTIEPQTNGQPGIAFGHFVPTNTGGVRTEWEFVSFTAETQFVSEATNVLYDFNDDGLADLAVYEEATGNWYILTSETEADSFNWGFPGATPVPGDYNGDGQPQAAVYDANGGVWYVLNREEGTFETFLWGFAGALPVPADYNGDGQTDVAVYDPLRGNWFIFFPADGTARAENWGFPGAIPVPADYDGDGEADLAVYQESTGNWTIRTSENLEVLVFNWGFPGAIPVPADYTGDGVAEPTVYGLAGQTWYILLGDEADVVTWGVQGGLPVPLDIDGDGLLDLGVYQRQTGDWRILLRESDGISVERNWGFNGALPVDPSLWNVLRLRGNGG